MKRRFSWWMVFCVVVGCTICLATGPTAAPAQTSPSVMTMGTHPLGSLFNALGSGLATVLSAHVGREVKVMPTTGPVEWIPMMSGTEVDLGVSNNFDVQLAWRAQGPFEKLAKGKKTSARLLTSGAYSLHGPVAAVDAGIKTGNDLKGKRYVGECPGSPAGSALAKAYLANFNLKPSDVRMISTPSVAAAVSLVTDGRADCGWGQVGMGVIQELDVKRGARFVSLDPSPEGLKRLQTHFPGAIVKVEPGPGMVGIKEPTYVNAYDSYLVGREGLSNEIAYTIVKTLWEHNSELMPIHVAFKTWTPDRFVTKLATIAYHPGAIKFYKEKGVWDKEMDAVQEKLLKEQK